MSSDKSRRAKILIQSAIVHLGLLIILTFSGTRHAQAKAAFPAVCTSTPEKWVLLQITGAQEADLTHLPPDNTDRVISSSCLQYLLTMTIKEDDKGLPRQVTIKNAIIKERVDIRALDIPYGIYLWDCHFESDVDFSASRFKRNFNLISTTFDSTANLDFIKVSGNLVATKTLFRGPAYFIGMKIDGYISLYDSTFEGPADFESLTTPIFDATDAHFKNKERPPAFTNMQAGLVHFTLDSFDGQPEISGMTYEAFDIDKQSTSQKLLALCQKAKFSPSAYTQAEAFVRARAPSYVADEIFIEQRKRERTEGTGYLSWLWNYILEKLVGYGRKPERAWYISAVVIVVGYFVFRRRSGMVPRKPEDESRPYSPFWYSIDLFAPVINLKVADTWEPVEKRRFARNYMYLQRILGWILVPIGIAVWTGIIK